MDVVISAIQTIDTSSIVKVIRVDSWSVSAIHFELLAANLDSRERLPSPGTREGCSMSKTADRVLGVHGLVRPYFFNPGGYFICPANLS